MHLTQQYNCPQCAWAQPAVLPCMLPTRHGRLPPLCCHLCAATSVLPRHGTQQARACWPTSMERTKPDTVRVDCAEEREDSIQQRTKTYEQKVQGQECEMWVPSSQTRRGRVLLLWEGDGAAVGRSSTALAPNITHMQKYPAVQHSVVTSSLCADHLWADWKPESQRGCKAARWGEQEAWLLQGKLSAISIASQHIRDTNIRERKTIWVEWQQQHSARCSSEGLRHSCGTGQGGISPHWQGSDFVLWCKSATAELSQ